MAEQNFRSQVEIEVDSALCTPARFSFFISRIETNSVLVDGSLPLSGGCTEMSM